VGYIHYNPVKHWYVRKAVEQPYSSFHLYVRNGMYSHDLAAEDDIRNLEME